MLFLYAYLAFIPENVFFENFSYIQFEHMFAYYCIVLMLIIKKLLYNVKKHANSLKRVILPSYAFFLLVLLIISMLLTILLFSYLPYIDKSLFSKYSGYAKKVYKRG